jgi:hypothetical protein
VLIAARLEQVPERLARHVLGLKIILLFF